MSAAAAALRLRPHAKPHQAFERAARSTICLAESTVLLDISIVNVALALDVRLGLYLSYDRVCSGWSTHTRSRSPGS